MNLKLFVLRCLTIILLLIPIAGATYDVVSGIASNSTEYTTSASYGELHNISLATGTGTVFIKASWDARMNFTAPLYGRFLRDGVSLGRFNLTQSVYAQVGSYELALNETTGTHYYGWEVYSNKKGTIYSRNFSAVFLANGTYGTGAGGNITSITGAPAGVLDCTGTDDITCTVTAPTTWTTTQNTTYEGQISTLQSNDTTDRSYVNNTFLPILTYSGNYPNSSLVNYLPISTYSGNFPNSSLINYLLITTYGGNFPNNSLSNYLLTSLFATNFNTSFHAEIPQCTSGQKLNSTDGETLICDTDATGAAGGNVSSVTAQSPLTYTGTTDVIIKDERTTYPNSTLGSKESSWDAKEPAISQGVSPQFWMFNKTWQNITTTWITEGTNQWFTNARAISAVQSILDAMNTSSATNNTNSQNRDDIINSTKVNKTDAGELSGGTLAYSIFPVNITTGTMGASFSNGTNAISVGTSKKMRQATAGIITGLYVNQTDDVACSGNVTVTSSGAYKSHIAWSSAANASSTGLSATFTAGEWLLYNMTENTGCIDFTFVQVHTKTS